MKHVEDSELVSQAKLGNAEAFAGLVRKYAEAVKGYCYYRTGNFEDARDLCQETFVIAYTKLHQLRQVSKFGAWIRKIAANVCVRFLTKRRDIPVEEVRIADPPGPSDTVLLVRYALHNLPDNERLALVMHYVDGLPYKDIADFLEISQGAVRGRLQRGREMLKKEVLAMTREAFDEERLDEGFVAKTVSLTHSFTRLGLGWSPDARHIMFLRHFPDRGTQLWISDTEGADAQPISEIGFQELYGWAPDSKRIVYACTQERRPESPGALFIYDLQSQENRQIASGFEWEAIDGLKGALTGWSNPVWSADSRRIAILMKRFTDDRPWVDTFVFDAETGERTALTPGHLNTGAMWPGDWLPDGKRFALLSSSEEGKNGRIWVCDYDGGNLRPITPEDWNVSSDPRCCPNRDIIAFCTSHGRVEEGGADLWFINSDGSNPRQLTNGSSSVDTDRVHFAHPEWTSDGRYVVCLTGRVDRGGHECHGIRLVDSETGVVTTILENDPYSSKFIIGFRNKISICPNGKRIAFTVGEFVVDNRNKHTPVYSNRQDVLCFYDIPTKRLHVVDRTQPEEDGTLLFHCGYNWMPLWSPDGKRLLCTKGKVKDMNDWRKPIGEEGRLVGGLGSVWDVLHPASEDNLCFYEVDVR